MSTVKEYIAKLHEFTNSIDFESNDFSEIEKFIPIISKILGMDHLSTYVMNIPTKNFVLTRARKNNNKGEFFKRLNQISYPDRKYVKKHGRANVWNESRFYCSDLPATSLFEVRPKNEWITTMDIKITKPILHLLAVDMNSKYNVTGDENFSNADIAFNKFLSEKFVQEIDSENHCLYLPTAVLTNLLLPTFDGIVYPSVASNLKGENFALKKEIIDNYATVVEARVQESYAHQSDGTFKIKCLFRANGITDSGNINWKSVNCNGHNIDETVYH